MSAFFCFSSTPLPPSSADVLYVWSLRTFVRIFTCDQQLCDVLVPQDVVLVEAQLAVFHSYLGGVELHQREERGHDKTL